MFWWLVYSHKSTVNDKVQRNILGLATKGRCFCYTVGGGGGGVLLRGEKCLLGPSFHIVSHSPVQNAPVFLLFLCHGEGNFSELFFNCNWIFLFLQ